MAAPISPASAAVIDAAFWKQEITDRWTDLYAGWTAYTPVWTAATTNPGLGNGTLQGAYKRADVGKAVLFRLRLVMGSTTTYGSGAWSFSLPPGHNVQAFQTLGGHVHDVLPNSNRWAVCVLLSNSGGIERIAVDGSTGLASGAPHAWAVNDQLVLTGSYEIS
ncbi:hypothetical protein ACQP1V_36220 [Microtetraspora malaysiensis]|uniref:hypothetical protein n=1 Tax=Microtetraspora malaysiensis TaxID=161358 RepID=UPI003D91A0A2